MTESTAPTEIPVGTRVRTFGHLYEEIRDGYEGSYRGATRTTLLETGELVDPAHRVEIPGFGLRWFRRVEVVGSAPVEPEPEPRFAIVVALFDGGEVVFDGVLQFPVPMNAQEPLALMGADGPVAVFAPGKWVSVARVPVVAPETPSEPEEDSARRLAKTAAHVAHRLRDFTDNSDRLLTHEKVRLRSLAERLADDSEPLR